MDFPQSAIVCGKVAICADWLEVLHRDCLRKSPNKLGNLALPSAPINRPERDPIFFASARSMLADSSRFPGAALSLRDYLVWPHQVLAMTVARKGKVVFAISRLPAADVTAACRKSDLIIAGETIAAFEKAVDFSAVTSSRFGDPES